VISQPALSLPTASDPPKTPQERRRAARCRCHLKSPCRLFGGGRDDCWVGAVQDISVIGFGLVLNVEPPRGTYLDVSLQSPDGERYLAPQLVRIRRVLAQDDGTWLVGCTFVKKLSPAELQALL
jgi:hypothetical protein